jgi:hypothetical protein
MGNAEQECYLDEFSFRIIWEALGYTLASAYL